MSIKYLAALYLLFGIILASTTTHAQQSPAPDFIPDFTFQGSQLNHWQPLGEAQWDARDGVVTGNAGSGSGLLLFDDAFESVGVFARFRCDGVCDAGVLIRVEQTSSGMKAILIAIEDETIAPYRVTIDRQGRIVSKESARGAGRRPDGQDEALMSDVLREATDSLTAPVRIKANQWNTVEIFADGNAIYNHLNNIRNGIRGGTAVDPTPAPSTGSSAIIPTDMRRYGYGPIALYVGSGSVEFDQISVKNLLKLTIEPERTSSRFRVQRVNTFYYAWGADVADIDRDGIQDLVSGPYYYLGPDFLQRYEFYPARVFNPGLEYISDMLTFAHDWTGDGWPDVVRTERRPLVMHVNPGSDKRYWDYIEILPDVCSETAIRADVDGDAQPEIVYVANDGRVAYGEPDPAAPHDPWVVRKISEPVIAGCNSHGLGTGDVNGDGLTDILQARGWWEQPADGPDKGNWIYHHDWFGRLTRSPQHPGGAEISVYDFNGDGLNDVVTSLSAHGWGLAWYEQKRDAAGNISFDEHMIMNNFASKNAGDVTFSQVHSGATLGDIDRDGIMDFVTGKRHWSHLDAFTDPDPDGEPVIYWYRTVRNPNAPGGVEFVPELIHNKSGVGARSKR